jgi:hypothetical protein
VSAPVLGQLQFNSGASSPKQRWKAPRKYLKASVYSRLSRNEIHHRDMGSDSDDCQLSLSRQMQPGLPLAGSGAQAAAPSVSAPSVNIPRVDLTSSNKPCTQPGSITIPSSAPDATPALPFGTPQSVFGGQTVTKDVAVNTSSPPGVTSPFQPAFGNPRTILSAPSSGFGGPPSMKDAPLSTSSSPGGTSSFNLQLTIRNPQPVFGAPTFSFVGPQSMNTQPFLTTPIPAGASAFQPGVSVSQSASGGSPSKKNHPSFPLFAPAGTLAVQSANSTQPQAGFGSAPSAFGSPKNDPFSKLLANAAPAGTVAGLPAFGNLQNVFGNSAVYSTFSSLQSFLSSAAPASSPPSGASQWTASSSKDDASQIAVGVGFQPPRPNLTFFFHNGQDWEMLTGQGHLEYTAAYWKWKDAPLNPKAECVISNVEYVLNWHAMVSESFLFLLALLTFHLLSDEMKRRLGRLYFQDLLQNFQISAL